MVSHQTNSKGGTLFHTRKAPMNSFPLPKLRIHFVFVLNKNVRTHRFYFLKDNHNFDLVFSFLFFPTIDANLRRKWQATPMDRGAWWVTVHRVSESQTQVIMHI